LGLLRAFAPPGLSLNWKRGGCASSVRAVGTKHDTSNDVIVNVLASRYASADMRAIWSAHRARVARARPRIAVLKGQRDLGLDVPEAAIAAYEAVRDKVDLDSIRKREEVTHHDVKARIDEFCAPGRPPAHHRGMTSRDLTENVEHLQTYRSMELILRKAVAAVLRLSAKAQQYRDLHFGAHAQRPRPAHDAGAPLLDVWRGTFYRREARSHQRKYPARGSRAPSARASTNSPS
jgi:hypothetical protein